jgi:Uma2 family endonuclease
MAKYAEQLISPQQYLERERVTEYKSEYLGGRIFAMVGASRGHNLITTNLGRELSLRLKGRSCETYGSDMRVKVSQTGLYTYPDMVVVCGEARFEDAHLDTLLNPTVIFEVLSPLTEAYDRGDKFTHYRRLESLVEYLLISQYRCQVERYVRQADGQWLLSEFNDPQGKLELTSIGCQIPLAEIYERVEFAKVEGMPPGTHQQS